MRARGVATIIAAAVLLAGCGGSSKSSSSSSSSPSSVTAPATGGTRVSGRDGGFSAVIPTGFTDVTSSANTGSFTIQLAATAPRSGGFATNLNVIREQVQAGTQISSLTAREIAVLRRQLRTAKRFSSIRSTTVDGQPARQLDYFATPIRNTVLHISQVFVIDKNYAYTITFTALPAAYPSKVVALSQLLSSWQWA